MNFKTVTCLNCGWVHMEVSRTFAQKEVADFNSFFWGLPAEKRQDFYGDKGASLADYERCHCGNSYTYFRDSRPGDCPDGVTIGPIIARDE